MNDSPTVIREWCLGHDVPDAAEVYNLLRGQDGLFRNDEGTYWDFKETWPFSLSDDYFAGIARAICGFSNAHGGILVFGVHDKHRTAGFNNVHINFDKFKQALKSLVDDDIPMSIQSYENADIGNIDVLFIHTRRLGVRPYKFKRKCGKYSQNITWVRNGHEIIQATPANFPLIFCRGLDSNADGLNTELDGSLPPSPATLKRFIGRFSVIEDLFDWLQNSDEPRTYLYGKGGSGKSTVAFEFAQLLKSFGSELCLYGGNKIDGVIFLSAKEKEMITIGNPTVATLEPDFRDEGELYAKILFYGRWILNEEKIKSMGLDELKGEVKLFFDYSSVVLFIDDIDTLTTKRVDPGSDYLYRILCRANRTSKVVYTLRNVPSQSIVNSIEVPGLQGADYTEFVSECAHEFKVQQPSVQIRDGVLPNLSERRPLVIESIIALVRTCGNYTKAIEVFEQHAGEHIRDYVFSREWDALSKDSAPRSLLVALSDLNQPTTFTQLETVLQIDPSRLQDAIGEVREMFLTVDQVGDEALFSLAPLTRQFVAGRKTSVQYYSIIKERVRTFKRHVHISNPKVAEEVSRVERIIPPRFATHLPEDAMKAWDVVNSSKLPPIVTEDPLFRSLYGYVASSCNPPRLSEARTAFEYAQQMKFEPDFRYLLAWFAAEKRSGVFDRRCEKIADIVISGKKYSEIEKIEMTSRKAASMYARGKDQIYTDYVDAIQCFKDSVALHLKAFRLNCLTGSSYADVSERYARNTMYTLVNYLQKESPWEVLDLIRALSEMKNIYLDPIEDAVDARGLVALGREEIINRTRNRIKGLPELLTNPDLWLATSSGQRFAEKIRSIDRALSNNLKGRAAKN